MILQFGRVQRNAHRHALDDLDPVAAGILRRQQGKGIAGARTQSHHLAVIGDAATIDVGCHRRRLADAHVGQLHFLEIGVHPDMVQRHHRQ
jgi:hypothetical protein